jgi:cytolysin-activating lysine-acyltransferase
MTDARKSARRDKRMNKATAAAKRPGEQLLGEAALRDALAGFGVLPASAAGSGSARGASAANGSHIAGSTHAQAASPKTVSQVLGEIIWLMTQSPRHKALPLGDLEWLVMPAILLRQFRIFYKGEQPVGVALWALVDEIVAKRIDTGDKRLSAVEWKNGTSVRIIDVVAPFGGEAEMRGQLETSLPS